MLYVRKMTETANNRYADKMWAVHVCNRASLHFTKKEILKFPRTRHMHDPLLIRNLDTFIG